jgi:tetratricopeptide (TPR) repeat protein
MSAAREGKHVGIKPSTTWALAILALVVAVVLAYAGSLGGAFVYDDIPAIVENPTLRDPGNLAALLASPGDQAGTVGGRPALNLSLALNYSLGGTRPLGYHAVNIAIHIAATLLLFGIVRRTLQGGAGLRVEKENAPTPKGRLPWRSELSGSDAVLIAFFSALLWAVHPLQTESVTYVVQRAESQMGLFYLLTIYCFIRYADSHPSIAGSRRHRGRNRPRIFWAALSAAACLFGMATKEAMVSAPLVVLLYDRTFVTGSFGNAWQARRGFYMGLGASWILLAALVASTNGRGGSAGFDTPVGVWIYALTQFVAIAHYLRLSFWPVGLVFDYGTALVRSPADAIAPFLFIALLLAGTVLALRRRPEIGFAALCFFALIAPSSSFIPVITEPIAEHRMYLPLAAVSVLTVAAVFFALVKLTPRFSRLVLIIIGCAAAMGLGVATVRRNIDYRSPIALWAGTVKEVPGNPRAHNNLAEAYLASGQKGKSVSEFVAAVRADPGYAPAQYNLGVALLDSGYAAEAIPHLKRALSAPRHKAELHVYLGEALERTGQNAYAAANYREALRLEPENTEAAFGLGNNLAKMGQYAESVDAYHLAVARSPDRVDIRNNLANALGSLGRIDEAIAEYREALKRDPGNAAVRENLDRARGGKGSATGP